MSLFALPPMIHQTHLFLADADILSTGLDGSGDGWGGLVALALVVATILFAMYVAAREEWQFAQQPNLNRGARRDSSPSYKGRTTA